MAEQHRVRPERNGLRHDVGGRASGRTRHPAAAPHGRRRSAARRWRAARAAAGGRPECGCRSTGCGTLMRRMRMVAPFGRARPFPPLMSAADGGRSPWVKGSGRAGHGLSRLRHSWHGAEAAFAPMEFADRGGEIVGIEVRPHPVGEVELRVGALPQQEVREAFLAAGADQQIDVAAIARRVAGDEAAEALARELVCCDRTRPPRAGWRRAPSSRGRRADAASDRPLSRASAAAMSAARPSGNRSRRPMTVNRMPLSCSRAISVCR